MMNSLKSYSIVTAAYWGFTLTDGALRMLVVLFFHQLGYGALDIALLFLFYEFFGIVTNLFGGWLATRFGLNQTMFAGLLLQILALYLLSLENYLSIPFVMLAQAISGIAKDLNKMSAKSSLKLLLPNDQQGKLFKWVALLTGSKNALKGAGFFLGGVLLSWLGYHDSLITLAVGLAIISVACWIGLPNNLNTKTRSVKFTQLFSKSEAINLLSAARFFLFGARDIWFVIALPVFLQTTLEWQHHQVGTLLAGWIILYGGVQALTPKLLGYQQLKHAPTGATASKANFILLLAPALMLLANYFQLDLTWIVILGLLAFAVLFAFNSAIHSFLILAYADQKNVSLDVGFYYMSNAAGRLVGIVLSGLVFQQYGFFACIGGSVIMLFLSSIFASQLKS